MRTWSRPEKQFIEKHMWNLTPLELFHLWRKEKFPSRTYDSVTRMARRLKLDKKPLKQTNLIKAFPSPEVKAKSRASAAEFLRELAEMPDPTPHIPAIQSKDSSLVIVLSDLHFGKKKGGRFSLEKARERLLKIPEQILTSSFNVDNLDEIVVCLVGDIVEGEDIYSTQGTHVEAPVIYQAQEATSAIWELLLLLKEVFQVPVRVETCPGNHGRMSKTANEASNWDNVVYQMLGLAAGMYDNENLVVNVNYDQMIVVDVKDKRGLLYHHGTKHLGTPAMKVKFAGWILMFDIDFAVHGHHHHFGIETYQGRFYIHNGSLCGGDDLSERLAEDEPARQAFFLVEPNKPISHYSFFEW